MMSEKKPKKPTKPFGYLAFSKTGTVRQNIFKLSEEKALQEEQVINRFVELHNECYPNFIITEISQLPENDHDFVVYVNNIFTNIQLTELVDRTYAVKLTPDEYKHTSWDAYELRDSGGIPWGINLEKKNNALTDLIKQKIAKCYSQINNQDFWLVIFCTSFYEGESSQNGYIVVSEALKRARLYLKENRNHVFSKIWFFNMLTRPVLIWPEESKL